MKFIKWTLFVALLSLLFVVSDTQARTSAFSTEQSPGQFGVPPGVLTPHDLTGVDQNEREVNLEKLAGENGLVLYFVRSANRSKYGTLQLKDVSRRGSIIEDAGYNIVVVTNESVKALAHFANKYDFPYTMISDTDSEIIKAFEIMNESYVPGTSYYGVAHPAVYIIGKDGLILDKFFNVDISKRPDVADVRKAVDFYDDYSSAIKRTE